MTTQLTITTANKETKEVVFSTPSITIGRSAANDIQLLDPKVSRSHCRIEKTEQGIVLFDLGSKNGIYVNGNKYQTAQIKQTDILKIGSNIFDLSHTGPKKVEVEERTMELQALPWIPPQDERTREVNIRSSIGLDKLKQGRRISPPNIFSNREKYTQFIKNNRFYIAAFIIFCLPIIALSTNYYIHSHSLNSQPLPSTSSSVAGAGDGALAQKEQGVKKATSPEDIETATQIAREANIILESGDFDQALMLFDKALGYDPESILAKQGRTATMAYIENLADICFSRGQKFLLALDYQRALKEFETVVLLLQKQPHNKLYMDATKLIKQSQLKASN